MIVSDTQSVNTNERRWWYPMNPLCVRQEDIPDPSRRSVVGDARFRSYDTAERRTVVADELTPKQLDEFKRTLEALRAELENLLELSKGASDTVSLDQPIGRVSRIDAIQQQKMAKANRQNHTIRLQQVNAALVAMTTGEFGECRECEEDIGYGRLQARPEAPLCLTCQQAAERRRQT